MKLDEELGLAPPKAVRPRTGAPRAVPADGAADTLLGPPRTADVSTAPDAASVMDPLEALGRFVVTDDKVKRMKEARMLWRGIVAASHLIVWAAPGNGGKTSLAMFAAGELARDHHVLFFQEDAPASSLPALYKHAQEHGYQLLNSTLADSSPPEMLRVLQDMAHSGSQLDGYVLIFDTLKKFADLMSKGGTRAFFKLMRDLTVRGATVLLLGHTNKHRGTDGKLIFEGVGDVRNDVDELLYIEATPKDPAGRVTLTIRPDKVRACIEEQSFQLDTRTMTMQPSEHVDNGAATGKERKQTGEDRPVIESIREVLEAGPMSYTKLVDRVASSAGRSRRAVQRVIGRYLVDEPNDRRGLWYQQRLPVNNTKLIALVANELIDVPRGVG